MEKCLRMNSFLVNSTLEACKLTKNYLLQKFFSRILSKF